MEKLTEDLLAEKLNELSDWKLTDEKWIEKKYRFQEFLKGIDFVNKIGLLSEDVNHHPFISIDYKVVTLKLSSWQAKGLIELDFQLAAKYDIIYQSIKHQG